MILAHYYRNIYHQSLSPPKKICIQIKCFALVLAIPRLTPDCAHSWKAEETHGVQGTRTQAGYRQSRNPTPAVLWPCQNSFKKFSILTSLLPRGSVISIPNPTTSGLPCAQLTLVQAHHSLSSF